VAPLDDVNPAWAKVLLSGREPRWSHFLWNRSRHEALLSASAGFFSSCFGFCPLIRIWRFAEQLFIFGPLTMTMKVLWSLEASVTVYQLTQFLHPRRLESSAVKITILS